MKHHLAQIQEFTHGHTPLMLDLLVEMCKKDLKRIAKREQRLNQANLESIESFKSAMSKRQELVKELKATAQNNKAHLE